MSAISLTRLYELLVPKLGKEATESLITYNESKTKSEVENTCKHLPTKDDISLMKTDLANLKTDLARFKGDLEAKIESKFSESIKWMFVFWVGQVIATAASILLFLKK